MTPQQALQILNQVTAQLNANRDTHANIAIALQTLERAVSELAFLKTPKEVPKEGTGKK